MNRNLTITVFILFLYSIFCLLFSLGDLKYILGDGVEILEYICTNSWQLGRGADAGFFASFVSNGIYAYIYPDFLHCGDKPPYLILLIINSFFLSGIIYLVRDISRNNIYCILIVLGLLYGAYSLQVASKELVLSFFFLLSLKFYFLSLSNKLNYFSNHLVRSLGIFLIVLCSFARPTYALLLTPFALLYTRSKDDKVYQILLNCSFALIICLPFFINYLWHAGFFESLIGDIDLIISDLLSRYQREYSNVFPSLDSLFTTQALIRRLFVLLFAYRHLYFVDDIPLYIALIASKISIMTSILLSLFFVSFPHLFKNNFLFTNEKKIWILCSLMSVFIYPFPHDRYFLPLVPVLLALMFDTKLIKSQKFQ